MSADSSKAVFLSYASQDAEAAKRIAESLRAAGLGRSEGGHDANRE